MKKTARFIWCSLGGDCFHVSERKQTSDLISPPQEKTWDMRTKTPKLLILFQWRVQWHNRLKNDCQLFVQRQRFTNRTNGQLRQDPDPQRQQKVSDSVKNLELQLTWKPPIAYCILSVTSIQKCMTLYCQQGYFLWWSQHFLSSSAVGQGSSSSRETDHWPAAHY